MDYSSHLKKSLHTFITSIVKDCFCEVRLIQENTIRIRLSIPYGIDGKMIFYYTISAIDVNDIYKEVYSYNSFSQLTTKLMSKPIHDDLSLKIHWFYKDYYKAAYEIPKDILKELN